MPLRTAPPVGDPRSSSAWPAYARFVIVIVCFFVCFINIKSSCRS